MRASAVSSVVLLSALGCGGGAEPIPFDDGRASTSGAEESLRAPYPDPPYGTKRGAIIENFRFLGWRQPMEADFDTDALGPVSLSDYYDPRGDKGIEYIVITATAVWCSVCKLEYQELRPAAIESYADRGVVFMGALFEDNNAGPARPSDAETWARTYDVSFPFVLDPSFKLSPFFDRTATPMTMIVDASNMEIVWMELGWAPAELPNGDPNPSSIWALLDRLTQ